MTTDQPSLSPQSSWTQPSPLTAMRLDRPTSSDLVRGGGWFGVAGGFLLAVDAIAHLFVDDTVTAEEMLGLPHELWHLPGVIGIMLTLIGLIDIHLHQASRSGRLGQVGFVLLIVGVTLGAAYSTIFHGIFLPSLERLQEGLFEDFIDNGTSTAQTIRGITVQAIGLGLGAILFGAATIRAKVLPRIGGGLIIAAAVFAATQEAFAGGQLISRLLFAAAFLLLGSATIKSRKELNGGDLA